jgi:hypothetical protein
MWIRAIFDQFPLSGKPTYRELRDERFKVEPGEILPCVSSCPDILESTDEYEVQLARVEEAQKSATVWVRWGHPLT